MLNSVCVMFGLLASISALESKEEMNKLYEYVRQDAERCMEEFEINFEDIKQAKMDESFDKIDPCFMACLLKAKNLLDENGMFDEKEAYAIAEKFMKDPDDLEKAKTVGKICTAVNEEDVSDGNEGCERAFLLFKCMVENKSQMA